MASKNDTSRQIRLPCEMAENADKVFQALNLNFSEAVRLFLDETIRRGKLPFRPNEDAEEKLTTLRKQESDYVDRVLGIGETSGMRFLKAIFGPTNGADMGDNDLIEWGRSVGLPVEKLSATTLEELFDSGLFPTDPYDSDVSLGLMPGTEDEPATVALLNTYYMETIRTNVRDVAAKMESRAINHYLQSCYDDNHPQKKEEG